MSKYTDEELRLHAIIAAQPSPVQRRASEAVLDSVNAEAAAEAQAAPDPLDLEAVAIEDRFGPDAEPEAEDVPEAEPVFAPFEAEEPESDFEAELEAEMAEAEAAAEAESDLRFGDDSF